MVCPDAGRVPRFTGPQQSVRRRLGLHPAACEEAAGFGGTDGAVSCDRPAVRPQPECFSGPLAGAGRTDLSGDPRGDLVALLREALSRHDAPRLPEKRRRQRIDLFTFCQDVVLPKVDRTGMAYGVEARPPLLDHRLVEWALSRPISAADDAAPKNALRRILTDRGLGFLLDQPKRGFSLQSKGRLSRHRMRAGISRHATDLGISPAWSRHLRSLRGDRLELDTLHFLAKWHEAVAIPSAGT